MRTRTIIALAAAALSATAACSREPGIRSYQLTGQILVVKPETNEVLVKHEDIPGFMPAMTMPYKVDDPALIRARVAGDLIKATLVVETERTCLSAITKTGSAPLPEDARTTIPAAAGVRILQHGDPVPETALIDQDGTITYNLRTVVVAPSGRIVATLDNNAWTALELANALRDAVAGHR